MKAARIHEYGKPVVPEDVPVPDMQPDEILVEVKACGMCRSDAQLEFAVFAARSTVCLNGFGFIKERFNQGPLFIS